MKRPYGIALIFIGFAVVTSLLVTSREVLAVFSGSEQALWTLLGGWCLWMGAGMWMAEGRFPGDESPSAIAKLLTLEALLLPVLLISIRVVPYPLSGQPWLGSPWIVFVLVVLLPALVMPLGAALALLYKGSKTKDDIILVLVGGVIGGLVFSFWFPVHFNPVDTAVMGSLALLASGGLILSDAGGHPGLKRGMVALFLVFGILFSFGFGANLDRETKRVGWGDGEIIQVLDVASGRLAVANIEDVFGFYMNGIPHFVSYDALAAEEVAHYALIQSDDPGTLLLIGGGESGSLREILRHPVDEVDFIEIDPMMMEVSRRFILKSDEDAMEDPRVTTLEEDGRHYVKTTDRSYDVIIVDLPAPNNVQYNRFYTREFFQELEEITNPGGVISINIPSPVETSPLSDAFQKDIYRTFSSVFADTMIVPGERTFILGSPGPGILTDNILVLEMRRERRWVDTRFVNRYLLRDEFDAGHDLVATLDGDFTANLDPRPGNFYYPNLLKDMKSLYIVAFLFTLLVGYVVWRRDKGPVLVGGASTGFSAIVILVSVSYYLQVFYGDLYSRMGPVIASFALGLVIGNLDTRRGLGRLKDVELEFIKVLVYMGILAYFVPWTISYLEGFLDDGRVDMAFLGLSLLAGYIAGLLVPLGVHLVQGDTTRFQVSMLTGGFLGSALVATFLLPIFSLPEVLMLPVASSFGIASLLFIRRRSGRG